MNVKKWKHPVSRSIVKLAVGCWILGICTFAYCVSPSEPIARMDVKSGHETRDTGLFGNYWWANRFHNHHRQIEAVKGKSVDLVMLGDSITHFWEWHWKSWAKFTKDLTVFNFGYRGDATHNLIWRIEHGELDGFKAKCIVLMIGTNNNWPESTNPVEVAEAIKKIVGMIRERQPQAKLVMHPIFPRGNAPGTKKDVTSSARNKKTNEIIEKFAKEDGKIVWIDFNDKLVDETGWVPKSIMHDGLHPSDAGYEIWMNALKPITDELRKPAAHCATLPTFDIAKPDAVLVDGAADTAKRVKLTPCRCLKRDVTVYVSGEEPISKVELVWNVAFPKDALFYCGAWERTYANAGWYKMDDKSAPQHRWKPWYFLVNDGERTDGYGLEVQPSVFGAWRVESERVVLSLDLRAGTNPLRLKGRELSACVLVKRQGKKDETPFAAAREFCRVMCPKPRFPKSPVYGYNDWYCAYGKNTAKNFLADAEVFLSCCKGLENRPYIVVDDGWQRNDFKNTPDDGLWAGVRWKWGMPMDEVAKRVKAMGGKPGLWYRPFWSCRGLPAFASAEMRERVKQDMRRFREWGMELVKIDYITQDWSFRWGKGMADTPMCAKNCNWDDSRTTAEVVRDLYAAMREGAGDDMIIIGCNALDHFAAGLFELQRTGDDTSGKEWDRTYKYGVNTLGHRMHHDRTFYVLDGDCIGLVSKGDVPWEKNRQWLDLLANSGTALFVSWKRELMDDDVRAALTEACRKASLVQPVAEPLDWMECVQPERWRFGDQEKTYDWNGVD